MSEVQGKLDFAAADQETLEQEMKRNKVTPESMRLSYYALVGAAMMYKEMFWRDDVDIVDNTPTPIVRLQSGKKIKSKKVEKSHQEHKAVYKKKVEYMNKRMYEEVEVMVAKMAPEAKIAFERTVEYLTACTEELVYARDQNEALGVLKAYNAGEFDFMFEASRKATAEKFIKENSDDTLSKEAVAPGTGAEQ